MYRRPKFLEVLISIREELAREADYDVDLFMDADVAHRFWLGMVNPAVALARGEITPRGPAAKVLELVPIGEPVFARYREQLEAAGRDDLARG